MNGSTARLLALAHKGVAHAHEAGADQVAVTVIASTFVDLAQRDGRLEQVSESRSLSLSVRLLVADRSSTHATSDLRPQALSAFLRRAVEVTRCLEPDPDRALPPKEACGVAEGVDLDLVDPARVTLAFETRRDRVARLEKEVRIAEDRVPMRSCTAWWSDGSKSSATVFSNGFEGTREASTVGAAVSISVEDKEGRLPEASSSYGCTHLPELPSERQIAREAWERVTARLGSRPAASGRYPLLVDRRVAGRLLEVLTGPLSGTALHFGRSCLSSRLGERIGPEGLHLWDDPLVPRGLGSQTYDADGFPAVRRAILEDGVLRTFFLGQYHARRLGMDPTTAAPSNVVLPPGPRSVAEIAADLPRAIYVESFLGGSTNTTTGDFSFGIRGALLSHGCVVHPVGEMNVAGNLLNLLPRFLEAADDPWTFGAWRVPTLCFDDLSFSGSSA
ncbi:MAG: TldD/PmbA family protein [Deltaproteobacteria bacterium]|nr:TldD/PmbA family protein [Deltaproteobacteria bacterium]